MSLNIVVVDDDRVTLNLLDDVIRNDNHSVRLASDGIEAQKLIQESRPDIVFTDWNMPHCDGIELCRWIRHHYSTPYIYIVVSTSRSSSSDAAIALSTGADEYLRKPIEAIEVKARIRAAERILTMESRHLTILALAKLAESRDSETGKHLERVRSYVRLLYRGLVEDSPYADEVATLDSEMLALTSCLHDIGKVGIADSILLKPGRLSDEEYALMKQHVEIGAEALAGALRNARGGEFLKMAYEIALTHHERFDGNGYPNGLSGTDIPLVGRICALADVYDALTSTRVYRGAMLHNAAHNILVQESGKQFDPVIIDTYIKNENKFREVAEQMAG